MWNNIYLYVLRFINVFCRCFTIKHRLNQSGMSLPPFGRNLSLCHFIGGPLMTLIPLALLRLTAMTGDTTPRFYSVPVYLHSDGSSVIIRAWVSRQANHHHFIQRSVNQSDYHRVHIMKWRQEAIETCPPTSGRGRHRVQNHLTITGLLPPSVCIRKDCPSVAVTVLYVSGCSGLQMSKWHCE